MAKFNLEYYKGNDQYTDGDIENELLSIAEQKLSVEDMETDRVNYPILYHFSHIRENILSWYPFAKNANVLEVGAGCGAITGMLCKKFKKVTSVELSKRRAKINYLRNQDQNNLEIMVGNFNEMKFSQPFDYIVLNGVFEYAIRFTDEKNPYVFFLQNLQRYLKKDGQIIIAIENRLGLKYFAGSAEDHTQEYFIGLDNYENTDAARTFSKEEIKDIFRQAGLTHYQFYYPYPDYKFPKEIFTDETITTMEYGKPYTNLESHNFSLFNETKMASALTKEGIIASFANSFLIFAGREAFSDKKKISYVRMSNDRKPEYAVMTSLTEEVGHKTAVKSAMSKMGQPHIDKLYQSSLKEEDGLRYLKGQKSGADIIYPFLEQKSLSSEVKSYIDQGNSDKVIEIFAEIYELLRHKSVEKTDYHNLEFSKTFGGKKLEGDSLPCIKPANIDLICENLFRDGDKLIVIDGEWIFDFYIPVQFILWRCINEICFKFPKLPELISREDIYSKFGINSDTEKIFWSWAVHFDKEYVGSRQLEKYAKAKATVPFKKILQDQLDAHLLQSSLYIDTGEGYSEGNKISTEVEIVKNRFSITYDLSQVKSITGLRFDPVEGRYCVCKLHVNTQAAAVNSAFSDEIGDWFITKDPIYELTSSGEWPSRLTVQGEIHLFKNQGILEHIEDKVEAIKKGILKPPLLVAEGQATGTQPAEGQAADCQSTEERPKEGQAAESKMSEVEANKKLKNAKPKKIKPHLRVKLFCDKENKKKNKRGR